MEYLIGISVLLAVLLLGALISAANERQRQALDGLRQQVEAWAEQDIRIKREKLARQVLVSEPLVWLEKTAAAALGSAPKLVSVMPWQKDDLTAIVALCHDGTRLVWTPTPRERLLKALKRKGKSLLAGMDGALLGDHPHRASHQELSVVTSGMFFDLEAGQVWQALCGAVLPIQRLTLYEVPAPGSEKS